MSSIEFGNSFARSFAYWLAIRRADLENHPEDCKYRHLKYHDGCLQTNLNHLRTILPQLSKKARRKIGEIISVELGGAK